MKDKISNLISVIQNDITHFSKWDFLAKYIAIVVIIWNSIILFKYYFEKNMAEKDCLKAEGYFLKYEEKRINTLWSYLDFLDKKGQSSSMDIELRLYLQTNNIYFTMLNNTLSYSFLYGLKEEDSLTIIYSPQYDNRIRELSINGIKKYSFQQEQNRLSDLISEKIWIIVIALIIHLIWKFRTYKNDTPQ